jgi:ATP-binding cassette, subfamily C, bacterial LapB
VYQVEEFSAAEVRDPVIAAVVRLAGKFGFNPPPGLFGLLPRDGDGRLPFHQAGVALDLVGLNWELQQLRKLPRRPEFYPALVRLADGAVVAVLELANQDMLVWRSAEAEAVWMPAADLAAEYGGELVTVVGNPDKLREEAAPWHSKSRKHWFWSELRKEQAAFRPILLASLLVNLLALALPLFSMNVYDRVIPNEAEATLWVLATGVLLAFSLEFALRSARTNVVDQIGKRLDLRLSQKIFSRILASPMSERRGSTGALAARVGEYAIVRDFFASTTIVTVVDMGFLVLFIAVIAYIAGWLALVPIAIITIMAAAGLYLQRKVTDASRDAQADHGLQQTMLVESMAGAETLKSISGERAMLGRWQSLAEIGSHSQLRLRRINALAVTMAATIQQISSVALVVGGYYLFAAGEITMGAIIAIVMLASRSLAPAGQLAFLLTRGRQARDALDSIEELFGKDDERQHGSMALPAVAAGLSVRLDEVSFAYPETSVNALDRINLTIAPGEKIAIIGRVASGKSTLGRIICGLYEAGEGAMSINGVDSRQFRPSELRQAFRFVGQDASLFTGSIKDNIAISKPGASDAEILSALNRSGAAAYLAKDETGFDRQVGEQGRRLSGGQRAFLSLSRAFLTPCELLFLDEPTGAMDSQTERLFVERLQQTLSEKQTLIVSTHRPSLFSLCDRIIVMDQGRVVADGPKDEILSQGGRQAGIDQ